MKSATKTRGHDGTVWLDASEPRWMTPPDQPGAARRLVLLGAPGVGKGTQAELLCAKTNGCHLSTGDIFRAAVEAKPGTRTPALEQAVQIMHRGELVPDETVLSVVREQIGCLRCKGGFLLDGFPRTISQAAALEELLRQEHIHLDAVLDYELSREEIVSRISGRRTCPNCKANFHVTANPPKVEGICDVCGSRLVQRDDDRPEVVRVRLRTYEERTKPLIDYYRERGLLVSIDASGTPEEVLRGTLVALKI